jgi:hypothetical protein
MWYAVAGGLAFDTGNKKATMAIAALSFVFNFFWASSGTVDDEGCGNGAG